METGRKVDKHMKKVFQNEGKGGVDNSYQQHKKDKSSARLSYHQISGGSFNASGNLYNVSTGNGQLGGLRSFVSRERSFVRPQTSAASARTHARQEDAHQHLPEGVLEIPRQRSFVHPEQLQAQSKDSAQQKRRGAPVNHRGKPAMEIYRPPTLRSSGVFEPGVVGGFYSNGKAMTGIYDSQGNFHHVAQGNLNHHKRSPGLNIHAKEFISFQGGVPLHHSKSSTNVNFYQGKEGLQHSKSGHNLRGGTKKEGKVHFNENKENDPENKKLGMTQRTSPTSGTESSGAVQSPIKRSKSLGSADLRQALEGTHDPLAGIGPLPQEAHRAIIDAMNDPNKLSARQLMEVVRHVFTRVLEASRHSEPTARVCINIIEKEKGETFLETLLNTCQEYYQERDRLLRNSQASSQGYPAGYTASHPRWIAYMAFLNEMYTQLKRRHIQLMTLRMRNSETSPGLHLLTLLAQCCYACLRGPYINSLSETECLFFVLTAVGKDIETNLPQHMAQVMGAARDAFLVTAHVSSVRKTLLQLIEMHASRWHLPASAVMYYYPGSSAK